MTTKTHQWKKGIPCKADGDDGDSLLWAGLLYAASGQSEYRTGIVESMDASGRCWRSPARVGIAKPNSFSRDMATGLLLAAAKDKTGGREFGICGSWLEAWISYVNANGGKICPDATDSRGSMTPAMWWRVAYIRPDLVPWYYRYTKYLLKPYLYVAAETCEPGYHRHLIASTLLMLYVLDGKRETWGWLKAAASKLDEDEQDNPFFMWLNLELDDAEYRMVEIENECPLYRSSGTQWAWERTYSEEAHRDSCGHDRDFITYLLRGSIK